MLRVVVKSLDWWGVRHARAYGAIDELLSAVSTAADDGKLWLAMAAALSATGPTGRRAAAKGIAALGLTSLLVNGPIKHLARRPRPSGLAALGMQPRGRAPRTSSFPSGHTASAAAFMVAAGAEQPALLFVLGPLTVLLGWSRVHGVRHFPTDVAAGAVLGSAMGLAVRAAWPERDTSAAEQDEAT
jgi:undecaprenyl-diphosphatase